MALICSSWFHLFFFFFGERRLRTRKTINTFKDDL